MYCQKLCCLEKYLLGTFNICFKNVIFIYFPPNLILNVRDKALYSSWYGTNKIGDKLKGIQETLRLLNRMLSLLYVNGHSLDLAMPTHKAKLLSSLYSFTNVNERNFCFCFCFFPRRGSTPSPSTSS